MTGLLWLIGGFSGSLWYLLPGADLDHWRGGVLSAFACGIFGLIVFFAPWERLPPIWLYLAIGLALPVVAVIMALNGGIEAPTTNYLFLVAVLVGYYVPPAAAAVFLGALMLVPLTPMFYDERALHATYIAKVVLTAPIFVGVGVAVVLAKRQLVTWRDEARDQALRDPLTGLANRRALTSALEAATTAPRPRIPPALVLVDLDDFKLANTLHGHVGGDRVLRHVAGLLRDLTRATDLPARLGGDEFALLVAGVPEGELPILCQRIVDVFHGANEHLAMAGFDVTASVGYAVHGVDGVGIDALLTAADERMRFAKREGKDRWGTVRAAPIAGHGARGGAPVLEPGSS